MQDKARSLIVTVGTMAYSYIKKIWEGCVVRRGKLLAQRYRDHLCKDYRDEKEIEN